MVFADSLAAWYRANARRLPWRQNREPYAVWVSEIMLQQTTVAAVIPYFERWMANFPTVEALAGADEQAVLSLWQGLGYYRRCRNLLAGARWVVANGWPGSAKEWLAVPGVGRYTAGAIASIALGEATPVVDGNVERVYARLIGDASSGSALTRNAWAWAAQNVLASAPGEWNQALMELGATVCRPVSPDCGACPVAERCEARLGGVVDQLPTAMAKRDTISLNFHVWIPICDGMFGVRQIPPGEWWEGMWEFPRFASAERPAWLFGEAVCDTTLRHTVTHHRITLHASVVALDEPYAELQWKSASDLEAIPMPAPQRKLSRFANQWLTVGRADSTATRSRGTGSALRSRPSSPSTSGKPAEPDAG